ncbi:MAG: heme-binding protein [Betaproteobacteria bacterium]|nr:heme-binding protein [Betaproteobacteria bacterium]
MRGLFAVSIVSACVASLPANAQLLSQKAISAGMALAIAETAIATCKTNGYAVSVSVVGRAGEVILQVRGDGTGPHTMENSFRKAYTSRTFRQTSGDFAKRYKDDPQLALVWLTNVVAAQGALPIKAGDDVIGAVGVSGAPGGEKDEVCAKAGIDKVADQLK